MADLFVSYAREDEVRVASLVAVLEAESWSVFWDRHIPVGQTWRSYIHKALQDARCVIVVWTKHSIESDWVIDEANEAKKKGVLVPVLLDRVEQPMGFRSIHAADLSEWSKKAKSSAVNVLMDDISEVLKRHGAGTRKRSSPKPRPLKEEPPRTKLKDFQALIKSIWLWFMVSGLGALVLSGALMLVSATAKRSEDRKVQAISLPDNTAVFVTFVNKSSKASTVSWIDPDGKEIRYCVLEPDQSCNQRTYIEHYWIIRSIDGREIGTYVAGQDGKSAVVKILEEE